MLAEIALKLETVDCPAVATFALAVEPVCPVPAAAWEYWLAKASAFWAFSNE